MKLEVPKTLSSEEKDFCELLVYGREPYIGNVRRCYEEVFKYDGDDSLLLAKKLLAREDVADYVNQLRSLVTYESQDLKTRLTEKLLKIIDETSTAKYCDRRGTPLSPAALRSVAVQASKALMDMYPLKVAQESKVEFSGNDGAGIVLNINVPKPNNNEEDTIVEE